MSCTEYLVGCEDPSDSAESIKLVFFVDETLCWDSTKKPEWSVLKVPSRKFLLWYFESENLENGRLLYNIKIDEWTSRARFPGKHALTAVVPYGDKFEFMDGRHRALWVANQSRDGMVLLAVASEIAKRVEMDILRMDVSRELNGHLTSVFFWINCKHISPFCEIGG